MSVKGGSICRHFFWESVYGLIGKGENNAGVKLPAITKHIRNIIASQELEEFSVCSILEHMGNDGISSGV